MINKKSLWFLTLFSLILVLSVYYITMPSELLITGGKKKVEETAKVNASKKENEASVEVEESEHKQIIFDILKGISKNFYMIEL